MKRLADNSSVHNSGREATKRRKKTINIHDNQVFPHSLLGCSPIAEAARGAGLTAIVLNLDVVGQQLFLASHSDEQRTSSPV